MHDATGMNLLAKLTKTRLCRVLSSTAGQSGRSGRDSGYLSEPFTRTSLSHNRTVASSTRSVKNLEGNNPPRHCEIISRSVPLPNTGCGQTTCSNMDFDPGGLSGPPRGPGRPLDVVVCELEVSDQTTTGSGSPAGLWWDARSSWPGRRWRVVAKASPGVR